MTIEPEDRQRIETRHVEILGQPPRVAPCDRMQVAEQVIADTLHLIRGTGGNATSIPIEAIPEIMFTMSASPSSGAR